MKHKHLVLLVALTFAFSSPALAQRSGHPGGAAPTSHGASGTPGGGEANKDAATGHTDMSHASPSTALSHNPAIGAKITALTGEPAATACDGFKNLGQCVAAAHVAKNLNITGGFDALKAKMMGTGGVSLGKAIEALEPTAKSKSEVKKANKQTADDMKEAETSS